MIRVRWTIALTALLLISACARPVVNPGPDPARLVLAVQRTVSAQTLRNGLSSQGPFPGRAVRLDNFLGPFWDIKAEVKQPDGSWWRLPPAPGQSNQLAGYTLKTRRVFLVPPGRHELRFRLEASINRSWEEQVGDPYIYRKGKDGVVYQDYNPRWRTQVATIYLVDLKSFATLEFQAGQKVVLQPFK